MGQRSTFLAFSTAKKSALCDMASFLNSVELYEKPKLKLYHKRFEKKNGEVSGVDVTVHRPDIFLNVKWI